MNILTKKPNLIFLLAIPIILMIGILKGDATIDINVHDTYYIIAYLHFTILISIFFGIMGIGYWLMQKANIKLSKWLIWVHVSLTFGGTFIIWISAQFYQADLMEYEFNNSLIVIRTLLIMLIILGQILFPINIIYGLIKK